MNEQYEPVTEVREEAPEYNPHPSPKPKKQRTGLKIVALALCCSLLGGIAGAGGVALFQHLGSPAADEAASTTMLVGDRKTQSINLASIDTSKELTAAEVYAQNVNSTVGITTSITTNFWGYTTTAAAAGSGFILTQDGYILTNYHVIENSNSITVTTYDGTAYDAQLIGYDESLDAAVLKVEAEDLVPVVLGVLAALVMMLVASLLMWRRGVDRVPFCEVDLVMVFFSAALMGWGNLLPALGAAAVCWGYMAASKGKRLPFFVPFVVIAVLQFALLGFPGLIKLF